MSYRGKATASAGPYVLYGTVHVPGVEGWPSTSKNVRLETVYASKREAYDAARAMLAQAGCGYMALYPEAV